MLCSDTSPDVKNFRDPVLETEYKSFAAQSDKRNTFHLLKKWYSSLEVPITLGLIWCYNNEENRLRRKYYSAPGCCIMNEKKTSW